jgi:hypothetical protein
MSLRRVIRNRNIEKEYKVITSDKKLFLVKESDIKRFKTIKYMLEDIEYTEDIEIPLENINQDTFKTILVFLEIDYNTEDYKNIGDINLEIKELKIFRRLSSKNIYDLVKACNYLDFNILLIRVLKYIGSNIKLLSEYEITKVFECQEEEVLNEGNSSIIEGDLITP